MTIVVGIKCVDGIVLGCDSMLTVGGFAQQSGQKIHVLNCAPQQLYAFSGDLSFAERFRAIAAACSNHINTSLHMLDYATTIGSAVVKNFSATGLDPLKVELITALAFVRNGEPELCEFTRGSQPRFLDAHHYRCVFGSGAVAATPFLKFLTDTLLPNRQPTLAEGKLLAAWAIKYSIDTLSGSVGGPIDMATIEKNGGSWILREYDQQEVQEALQAIRAASDALIAWRDGLGNDIVTEAPPQPPAQP